MAMSVGNGQGGLTSDPNVVPMIDILLVLLIIFMILQPLMRKTVDLQLPDPTQTQQTTTPTNDQIVLEVGPAGQYSINKQPVPPGRLAQRLKDIYSPRPDKIMFVKGSGQAKYQAIINAMDIARGAGVLVIGITPETTK